MARSSAERKRRKELPDHLLQRAFDHSGEALVGVKNHLVRRQRQRPFVHGFDEHAVGVLGAFQREHLRAFLARDHHRIHFAAADGAERFLRFGQARAELGEFAGRRGCVEELLRRVVFKAAILPFVTKSNSTNRPVMFVKLPMNRRTGGGNSLMSVGVATIWLSRARVGLLIDVNHFQVAVVLQFGVAQLTDAQDGLARRAVAPATNSRRTYLPAGRVARDFSKAVRRAAGLFLFSRAFISVNRRRANPSRRARVRYRKGCR